MENCTYIYLITKVHLWQTILSNLYPCVDFREMEVVIVQCVPVGASTLWVDLL